MYDTTSYENPDVLAADIRRRWDFMETSSAAAVMRSVCPGEWADITQVLRDFQLHPPTWLLAGGNRGAIPEMIDGMFTERGWAERRLDLETRGILLDKRGTIIQTLPPVMQEGYLVDNFKGSVVVDVEWNAKDGNLDRDLSAYRAWHEAGVIRAAVIITQNRISLRELAWEIWQAHQLTLPEDQRQRVPRLPIDLDTSTTTNLEKAALRVRRGVMGTCPLLVVAANRNTWNGQPYAV